MTTDHDERKPEQDAAKSKCGCTHSDAWRCAVAQNLSTAACQCECHHYLQKQDGAQTECCSKERPHVSLEGIDRSKPHWVSASLMVDASFVPGVTRQDAAREQMETPIILRKGGRAYPLDGKTLVKAFHADGTNSVRFVNDYKQGDWWHEGDDEDAYIVAYQVCEAVPVGALTAATAALAEERAARQRLENALLKQAEHRHLAEDRAMYESGLCTQAHADLQVAEAELVKVREELEKTEKIAFQRLEDAGAQQRLAIKMQEERDALALAIAEFREKARRALSMPVIHVGHPGTALKVQEMCINAIRALDPPSRERGEEPLRELEAAKDALQELGDNCIRDAKVIEAANALVPLLVEGWDEYDSSEDQAAGSAAVDALVKAVQERDSAIKEGRG